MNRLTEIEVAGFRSIRTTKPPLKMERLTILIGQNGAGKSNLLEIFTFLNAIRRGNLSNYVLKAGGADKVLHFGSRVTKMIRIRLSFDDGKNGYVIELEPDKEDRLIPTTEFAQYWVKRLYKRSYDEPLTPDGLEAGISRPARTAVQRYVRWHLAGWRRYHFHDTSSLAPLRKTANINDNHFLRADGSNLAAFLYLLRAKHPGAYGRIESVIRQAAPFFREFHLAPQQLNPNTIRLAWRHVGSDAYFGISTLSDGSLRFMALATLFLQPAELMPSVILFDEPELGLHPYAIALLAALIKKAAVHAQVIVASQSSRLLSYFEPEDVMVADRVQGATQYSRQSASELGTWLQDFSLGTLWEKGWLGGLPDSELS